MPVGGLATADDIYPSIGSVNCLYNVSTNQLLIGDTLYISRGMVNKGSWPIEGLYLSDNFPEPFEIIEYSIAVNGQPLTPLREESIPDLIFPGHVNYCWTIDTLGDGDISGYLHPGDSLSLEIKLICHEIGQYQLPLRTSVFQYNNQNYFSAAPSFSIEVVLSLDVDDDDQPALPKRFLNVRAYPNPFNGRVRIEYYGADLKASPVRLEIFNLLGQKVHSEEFVAKTAPGAVYWNTGTHLPGGLYLYRLTVGERQAMGKMVYLK
jgi:hypothetical protein